MIRRRRHNDRGNCVRHVCSVARRRAEEPRRQRASAQRQPAQRRICRQNSKLIHRACAAGSVVRRFQRRRIAAGLSLRTHHGRVAGEGH